MHAADAAGGEDVYAGAMRNPHCRSNSRGSIPGSRDSDCQITGAQLFDVSTAGDASNLILIHSHAKLSAEHGNRRGSSPFGTNNLFEALRSFQVLRTRQTLGDYG